MHKPHNPSEEWSKIILSTKYNTLVNDVENMFGDLYNKLGLHEPFDLNVERALTYFFPAKHFIPAEMLNNYTNNIGSNGFIWLDMDELSKQDKNSPHYFMRDGKKYIIDKEGNEGFPYHFNLDWMSSAWVTGKRQKYVDYMQTQPNQQVTLTQGSVIAQPSKPGMPQQGLSQKKPVTIQSEVPRHSQVPEINVVKLTNYPKNTQEEHKFFYDIVGDNYSAFLKDIEIAKQVGTINDKRSRGGIEQTALTAALNSSSPNKLIIQTLLENGINVNAKDGIAQSPLRIAIQQNASEEIIKLLLDYGANPNEVVKVYIPGSESEEKPLVDLVKESKIKGLLKDYSKNPVAVKQPGQSAATSVETNKLMNNLRQLTNVLSELQQQLL